MKLVAALALLLTAVPVAAGPWLDPGDSGLRHDIQLLADAGVLRAPVSTWPLSVGALQAALDPTGIDLRPDEQAALNRLTRRIERETRAEGPIVRATLAAAEHPRKIRTFQDTPRESAEAGVGIEWTGNRFAARLQTQWVHSPDDGKEWRVDDSYLGFALGNWMFAASTSDRYWGPGWQSSLIFSNNARPIPAFTIERNLTPAFSSKWLRWIGPWDLAFLWGYLDDDREIDHARVIALRLDARPLRGLEVGLSGLGLWCGTGQDCGADEVFDLMTGAGTTDEYDRVYGYDIRWAGRPFGFPVAAYAHLIGEDFGDGPSRLFVPNKLLGQFGLETWGEWSGLGSYRVFLEWADTECDFELQRKLTGDGDGGKPGCAYRNQRYKSGETYRKRSFAHSFDQDSSVATLGVVLQDLRDRSWLTTVAYGYLNRRGASLSTVVPNKTRYAEVEVSHRRGFFLGDLSLGVGYEYLDDRVEKSTDHDLRLFLEWDVAY